MADDARRAQIGRLVEEHHAALYRYAYHLSGCAADAEDLTQQVYLVAQQKLEQLRDCECARGWLFTILRNTYFKTQRQPQPQTAIDSIDVSLLADEASDPPLDRQALQEAIGALPEDFRVVVLMFYFERRSYLEIAQMLEIPPGTVMSRLARAKAYLRRWLDDGAAGEKVETAADRRASSGGSGRLLHGAGAGGNGTRSRGL